MKLLLSALLPLYTAAFAPSNLQNNILQSNALANSGSLQHLQQNNLALNAASMTTAELPEKLYFPKEKEIPKVLGGIKIGTRKLTVITGASSGLGLNTAATLVNTGRHFVVMACRDVEKGKKGTNILHLFVIMFFFSCICFHE